METEQKTIEQYVAERLEASKDEIIKNGIAGVEKSVQEAISWKAGYFIEQKVKEMFEDPELQETLKVELNKVKVSLVENMAKELLIITPKICASVGENMLKRSIKNLTEDSYSMRDFYKKMFD